MKETLAGIPPMIEPAGAFGCIFSSLTRLFDATMQKSGIVAPAVNVVLLPIQHPRPIEIGRVQGFDCACRHIGYEMMIGFLDLTSMSDSTFSPMEIYWWQPRFYIIAYITFAP